jgi:hypothetical protein
MSCWIFRGIRKVSHKYCRDNKNAFHVKYKSVLNCMEVNKRINTFHGLSCFSATTCDCFFERKRINCGYGTYCVTLACSHTHTHTHTHTLLYCSLSQFLAPFRAQSSSLHRCVFEQCNRTLRAILGITQYPFFSATQNVASETSRNFKFFVFTLLQFKCCFFLQVTSI